MTAVKALLVDLDGTLVETNEANRAAYSEALRPHGITIDERWWKANAVGRHWSGFLPLLLPNAERVELQAIAARKTEIYPEFLDKTVINKPLVAWIVASRPALRTALVTTASRTSATAVLRCHGLSDLFDETVCGDEVTAPKPAPEAYDVAARRLGVSAGACLVVEDSEVGAAAAKAFGAPCVLVRFGS